MPQNAFKLILQTAGHVEQEEQTGSEKVYESEKKSWPVCMFVLHFYFSRNERILF